MTERYRTNLERKYEPFLSILTEQKASEYIEVGCGAANITRILSRRLNGISSFVASDSCPDMLSLAERNLRAEGKPGCRLVKHNLLRPGTEFNGSAGSVLHSHGVLEHFDPPRIKGILEGLRRISPRMAHYVPGNKYGHKSFGDERLWSKAQWFEIASPKRIVDFNNGFDFALIYE